MIPRGLKPYPFKTKVDRIKAEIGSIKAGLDQIKQDPGRICQASWRVQYDT